MILTDDFDGMSLGETGGKELRIASSTHLSGNFVENGMVCWYGGRE